PEGTGSEQRAPRPALHADAPAGDGRLRRRLLRHLLPRRGLHAHRRAVPHVGRRGHVERARPPEGDHVRRGDVRGDRALGRRYHHARRAAGRPAPSGCSLRDPGDARARLGARGHPGGQPDDRGAGGRRLRLRRPGGLAGREPPRGLLRRPAPDGSRLVTAVVGSYPQPRWLVDPATLVSSGVPRVRAPEVWRVPDPLRGEAQDDAVRLAVGDMERAGVDIVSDGEQRRESYFNQFATALGGVDLDRPGVAMSRTGRPTRVPRVVGPIVREHPVHVGDARFLRDLTAREIKVTLPGPFTLTQLAQDDYYGDEERLAMAYADAVNAELRDLEG